MSMTVLRVDSSIIPSSVETAATGATRWTTGAFPPTPANDTPPLRIVWEQAPAVPDIGRAAPDRMRVEDSPALRHLAPALAVRLGSVGELFDPYALRFKTAPNPIDHLRAEHRANAAHTVRNPVDLRITTYNVGLLDLRATLGDLVPPFAWLGKIPIVGLPFKWLSDMTLRHVVSPKLEARREKLPQLIFSRSDDVVMLQEIWRPQDVPWFEAQARRYGYVALASPRDKSNDGLMTFVRATAIDPRKPIRVLAKAYEEQVWTESLAGVQRGYHRVSFTHPMLGPVHVFNTHMQAYPDAWKNRMHQAREIGLAARTVSDKNPEDVVVLGGDLNSGPYYDQDVWRGGTEPVGAWWKNAAAYGILEHYSGLADAAVLGLPATDVDADIRLSGQSGPQARWPHTADAASNALYDEQYHRDEPPARLDHIRVNASNSRIRVASSEMTFTEDIDTAAGRIEPSDHYGVRVRLEVARRQRAPSPAALRLPR